MAKKIDAFAVVVGLEYYDSEENYLSVGDLVTINSSRYVIKDEVQCGSIARQDKYYDLAIDTLNILLRDNIYHLIGTDYVFAEGEEIIKFFGDCNGDSIGKVIYTDGRIAILYLGTDYENYFFPEDDNEDDFTDLMDMLEEIEHDGMVKSLVVNDEVCYTITQKGIDFLEKKEREEEKNMDNVFGKLGFGKNTDSRFALSINGIAVRQANSDKYVVYNKENNEFVDTTDMLINIKDALFVLPAVEINVGDTVIHENKIYFIVSTGREIKAVSYDDCTQTVLIPKTTMFGLKYFTKVFSLFGDNFAATGELFSNPMMLMALINGEGNGDISKLLLMSSLTKGEVMNNPMMLSMLLKDNDKTDLSTIAMMSMFSNGINPFNTKANKNKENKGNE